MRRCKSSRGTRRSPERSPAHTWPPSTITPVMDSIAWPWMSRMVEKRPSLNRTSPCVPPSHSVPSSSTSMARTMPASSPSSRSYTAASPSGVDRHQALVRRREPQRAVVTCVHPGKVGVTDLVGQRRARRAVRRPGVAVRAGRRRATDPPRRSEAMRWMAPSPPAGSGPLSWPSASKRHRRVARRHPEAAVLVGVHGRHLAAILRDGRVGRAWPDISSE